MKTETTITWKDYKIIVDERNWSLYTVDVVQKGKNAGTERLDLKGHFSSPERAIGFISKLETIKEKETCELDDFLTRLQKNTKEVMAHVPMWVD